MHVEVGDDVADAALRQWPECGRVAHLPVLVVDVSGEDDVLLAVFEDAVECCLVLFRLCAYDVDEAFVFYLLFGFVDVRDRDFLFFRAFRELCRDAQEFQGASGVAVLPCRVRGAFLYRSFDERAVSERVLRAFAQNSL